jgi:transitional endoplasmic reticulum ATPase
MPLCTKTDVESKVCSPGDELDLDKIAEMTHGYTGADLAALAREAAMAALRKAINKGLINIEQDVIPQEVLSKAEGGHGRLHGGYEVHSPNGVE